jgi:hypothetical protein
MAQAAVRIPQAALRGVASGVLFMAFFGTLWACIGIAGLQGWGLPWLLLAALLVGSVFFAGGMRLIRASSRLTGQVTSANDQYWKKARRWFGIIFATEGLAMGVTSAICGATGHFDLMFPLVALIVGIHFFPLAPLFRMPTHYLTGALLCLLALGTLFFVPARAVLGGRQIIAWWVVVGFGSTLILWVTGLVIWLVGRRLLNRDLRQRAQEEQQAGAQGSLA